MTAAGGPPARLPIRTWKAGQKLWRVHRADREMWWFSADGRGRFDPTGSDGVGACYLAAAPLAAFVEVFRTMMELDESDVSDRRLSQVAFEDRDLRLADLPSRRALRLGITAEVGAGGDYSLSHRIASQAADAGLDGVRYRVRHDPAQRLVGVALFGTAGVGDRSWPQPVTGELDDELLDRARHAFGYRVLPRP